MSIQTLGSAITKFLLSHHRDSAHHHVDVSKKLIEKTKVECRLIEPSGPRGFFCCFSETIQGKQLRTGRNP